MINIDTISYITLRQLPVVWLVFILLVGSSFIVLVTGQASSNNTRITQISPVKAKESKRLFKQNCSKCHGSDGAGETTLGQIVGATDLTDPEWQKQVDDKELINSITYGLGQMPAFDRKLTKEQVMSLSSYVRSLGR